MIYNPSIKELMKMHKIYRMRKISGYSTQQHGTKTCTSPAPEVCLETENGMSFLPILKKVDPPCINLGEFSMRRRKSKAAKKFKSIRDIKDIYKVNIK